MSSMCRGEISVFGEITCADDGQLLPVIVAFKRVSSLSLCPFPVLFLLMLVVSFIGVDDAGYELVADNIFFVSSMTEMPSTPFSIFRASFSPLLHSFGRSI